MPFSTELQGAIDSVLAAYPDYQLGLSAAVLKPGFRTWTGVRSYSHEDESATKEMPFNVGSVVKNFEEALVLKLVEEGELSLNDPISKYLPSYRNGDVDIIVRQLMNHTSGVFNVFAHPDFP